MQCCEQILYLFETYKTFLRCIITEFECKVDVQNHKFGWVRFQNRVFKLLNETIFQFVNKSMLESIISFSSFYWIYYFLWIYTRISTNSLNVVFSIINPENLWKIFVNNEKLEYWEIETNNWTRLPFFDDKINFYFLYLFLNT